MAPDADERRLGPRLQRRDADHQVLARGRATRQPPAVVQLLGAERARVERADRRVARAAPAPCTCGTCRARRTSSRWRCRSSSRRRRSASRSARAPRCRRAGSAAGRARRRRRRAGSSMGSSSRASCGPRAHDARRRLLPPRARGARRSSARPTRRGRAAGRPRARSSTTSSARLMIALVSPAAIAIGRKAASSWWRSRQAEGDVRRAQAHVHAELVADEADRLERDRHGVGGGADGHRQRVDDDVLGRDAVVAGGARRSCARSPGAAAASRGCRSRRWPGR